jgi:hypothetical protein
MHLRSKTYSTAPAFLQLVHRAKKVKAITEPVPNIPQQSQLLPSWNPINQDFFNDTEEDDDYYNTNQRPPPIEAMQNWLQQQRQAAAQSRTNSANAVHDYIPPPPPPPPAAFRNTETPAAC